MGDISIETSYLFARPSFVSGMARTLDVGNTINDYNTQESSQQADFVALENDWMSVGGDMRQVINK